MINPKKLCKNHLLGEHNEIHKMVGNIKLKRSISGFIKKNCIEPKSIKRRHTVLVKEMKRRGYNHRSNLSKFDLSYLPENDLNYRINRKESIKDLKNRCDNCKNNF